MPEHPILGILGGTFDPVHNGHLHIAQYLLSHLPLQDIRFIPCKRPLLKAKAQASTQERIDMLQLALAQQKACTIDTREIERSTPSYMVETLKSLRADYPNQPIALILGSDAFMSLPDWYQWQHLLDYAHIIVVSRRRCNTPSHQALQRFLQQYQTQKISDLCQNLSGKIWWQQIPLIDISSTHIRDAISKQQDIRSQLPQAVWDYIQRNPIYL